MIPIYGLQDRDSDDRLHEVAGDHGAGIEQYLPGRQNADDRLDLARNLWEDQLHDTGRLLARHPLAMKASISAAMFGSSVDREGADELTA